MSSAFNPYEPSFLKYSKFQWSNDFMNDDSKIINLLHDLRSPVSNFFLENESHLLQAIGLNGRLQLIKFIEDHSPSHADVKDYLLYLLDLNANCIEDILKVSFSNFEMFKTYINNNQSVIRMTFRDCKKVYNDSIIKLIKNTFEYFGPASLESSILCVCCLKDIKLKDNSLNNYTAGGIRLDKIDAEYVIFPMHMLFSWFSNTNLLCQHTYMINDKDNVGSFIGDLCKMSYRERTATTISKYFI